MTLATAAWRRFPVRGPGRIVIPQLERRAARETIVAEGPFDTRLAVDPHNGPELSVYLWGLYAPEVEAAIGRLLEPGSRAIDAGASTGVITIMMGVLCRPGRVYAVERSADGCERIRRQAKLNSAEVEVVIGDPTRLDELIGELVVGDGVDLIRILVGGAEAEVLRGARSLIAAARPALIFDWCPESWSAIGEPPAPTAELLASLDYELFAPVIRPRPGWALGPPAFERFVPASLAELRAGTMPGANVVALPRGPAGESARRRLLAV